MVPDTDFDLRGLIETSLLEWENRVAAVAISGGCNFRCPYCHSWRYVTGLEKLAPIPISALFDLLERQRGWIDGVVFTGGEPTLQPGLARVMRRVKEYDVFIKLHTNGSNPEVVASLLDQGLIDCLALDFKAPLDSRLCRAAGLPDECDMAEQVGRSFRLAAESGLEREYHTTLAPSVIDVATLTEMGRDLEPGGVWILQQYERDDCLAPAAAGNRRYDDDELDALELAARACHGEVVLKRGT